MLFSSVKKSITNNRHTGQPVTALAKNGALVAGVYALIGVILTFWLPEPKPEMEEEHG